MYNIKPAYAQYTDDSLMLSLNKQKSSAKPKTRKRTHAYGLKSIEKEIMTAYNKEVKRVKNLPKCKIPSIESFTRKHLKGIHLKKHNKKAKKDESSVAVAVAESTPMPEPSAPVPESAPETETTVTEPAAPETTVTEPAAPETAAPETSETPEQESAAPATESESTEPVAPESESTEPKPAKPSIVDTISSMFSSSAEKPKTGGKNRSSNKKSSNKKSSSKKSRGKKSRKSSRKQK